jgi:hypothetical protein
VDVTCVQLSRRHGQKIQECTAAGETTSTHFSSGGVQVSAVLSRGGVVVATGIGVRSRHGTRLVLRPQHRIGAGRYLLALSRRGSQLLETVRIR